MSYVFVLPGSLLLNGWFFFVFQGTRRAYTYPFLGLVGGSFWERVEPLPAQKALPDRQAEMIDLVLPHLQAGCSTVPMQVSAWPSRQTSVFEHQGNPSLILRTMQFLVKGACHPYGPDAELHIKPFSPGSQDPHCFLVELL